MRETTTTTIGIKAYDMKIFSYYVTDSSQRLRIEIINWFTEMGVSATEYSIDCRLYTLTITAQKNVSYCAVYMPTDIVSMFVLRWNPTLINLE